ncbi:MAG: arylesterase [Novosphingobium sp.]
MKLYAALIGTVPALALAGCGGDTTPAALPSSAVASAAPEIPVIGAEVPILAFGDSLFAGYGLEPGESYPAQLERALRARGINARIANAGVSGNTTADALQRLAFTLDGQKRPPALALICLGGNDLLRGLPPEQARANLETILAELDRRGIPAVLMGMLAPPNLGAEYKRRFDAIYLEVARRHHAALVPFFLQSVIGKPDLIRADHIHPTAEGVGEIVGATVDTVAGALKT